MSAEWKKRADGDLKEEVKHGTNRRKRWREEKPAAKSPNISYLSLCPGGFPGTAHELLSFQNITPEAVIRTASPGSENNKQETLGPEPLQS